jgi:hypothetical protein
MKKEMRTIENEEEEERQSKIGDSWVGRTSKIQGRGEGGLYRVVGLPSTNVAHICTEAYPHPVQMCQPHICTRRSHHRYKCEAFVPSGLEEALTRPCEGIFVPGGSSN